MPPGEVCLRVRFDRRNKTHLIDRRMRPSTLARRRVPCKLPLKNCRRAPAAGTKWGAGEDHGSAAQVQPGVDRRVRHRPGRRRLHVLRAAAQERARRSAAQRRRDDGSGALHARLHRRQGAAAPALRPGQVPAGKRAGVRRHRDHAPAAKKYPDYSYKEAALNPTNPRNRAVDWESDIVNTFRNGSPLQGDLGRARHADRPLALPGAAAPDQGRGLPRLPHQSRDGAAGDGEALRPGATASAGS